MTDFVTLDIETSGEPWEGGLLVLGMLGAEELSPPPPASPNDPRLSDSDLIKVSHTKYDWRWLVMAGYEISGPLHDTQAMAYRLNENQPLDLASLVRKYLGYEMDKRLRRVGGRVLFTDDADNLHAMDEWREWPPHVMPQLREYNGRDLVSTRDLYLTLREALGDTMWDTYWEENDLPFTPVLLDMETAGIPIDLEASEQLRLELEPESVAAQQELKKAANLPDVFNLGSGDQLAAYLFNKVFTIRDGLRVGKYEVEALRSCLDGEHEDCEPDLHIESLMPEGFTINSIGRDIVHGQYTVRGRGLRETPPTESGKRSATSTPVLMMWHAGDEWVRDLIQWRKIEKVLTTYLRNFPKQSHNERGETYEQAKARCRREESSAAESPDLGRAGRPADASDAAAPERQSTRARVPTPVASREEDGSVLAGERSRTSRQRGPTGQSTRESSSPSSVDSPSDSLRAPGQPQLGRFRLYGRFNATGTKTGRLSSSGPNLQNIPARGTLGPRVRSLFRGNLVVGDYSQLEPRLMAHFSGDPVLTEAYATGADVYRITAHAIWGEWVEKEDPRREIGKVVFLGSQYGAGYKKLAMILALSGYPTDWATAKGYQDAMEDRYRVLYEWKDAIHRHVKQRGYVATISGAHRRLKHQFREKWNWKQVGYGERQAVNAIIQGSAGDIVRRAMILCRADPNLADLRMLFQVHDELGWEYPPAWDSGRLHIALGALNHYATEPGQHYGLRVPLVFEPHVVSSWADKGSAALDPDAAAEMDEEE